MDDSAYTHTYIPMEKAQEHFEQNCSVGYADTTGNKSKLHTTNANVTGVVPAMCSTTTSAHLITPNQYTLFVTWRRLALKFPREIALPTVIMPDTPG